MNGVLFSAYALVHYVCIRLDQADEQTQDQISIKIIY